MTTHTLSHYQQRIAEVVGDSTDPRHVEAFMRLQYGTLDHLDPQAFAREARISAACVAEAGATESEQLALSYGL